MKGRLKWFQNESKLIYQSQFLLERSKPDLYGLLEGMFSWRQLLQAWQEELDKSGFVGTKLMDLFKAYDSLHHDVLVAKFKVYGIDKNGF